MPAIREVLSGRSRHVRQDILVLGPVDDQNHIRCKYIVFNSLPVCSSSGPASDRVIVLTILMFSTTYVNADRHIGWGLCLVLSVRRQGAANSVTSYHYYLSVSTIDQQSTAAPANYLLSAATYSLLRALGNDMSPPAGDLFPDMFFAIVYVVHLLE